MEYPPLHFPISSSKMTTHNHYPIGIERRAVGLVGHYCLPHNPHSGSTWEGWTQMLCFMHRVLQFGWILVYLSGLWYPLSFVLFQTTRYLWDVPLRYRLRALSPLTKKIKKIIQLVSSISILRGCLFRG